MRAGGSGAVARVLRSWTGRGLCGGRAAVLGEGGQEAAAERVERTTVAGGIAAFDGSGQAAVGGHHSGQGEAQGRGDDVRFEAARCWAAYDQAEVSRVAAGQVGHPVCGDGGTYFGGDDDQGHVRGGQGFGARVGGVTGQVGDDQVVAACGGVQDGPHGLGGDGLDGAAVPGEYGQAAAGG